MDPKQQKKIGDRIAQLQAKGDVCSRAILLEQRRVEELDQALDQANAQIKTYRERTKKAAIEVLNLHQTTAKPAHQRADGLDPTKLADVNQKKRVMTLEDRLARLKERHSELKHQCGVKRALIDHMRRERMTADQVRDQYETKIVQARERLADFMEQSAALNEQVEALTKQRNDLLAANEDEAAQFECAIEEMDEEIAHQNTQFEEAINESAKQSQKFGDFTGIEKLGNYTVEEEEEIIQQISRLLEEKEKSVDGTETLEKHMLFFRKAFEELKRVTGIDDLDRLIQVFQKQEEQNFSLYNYIQTVSQEHEQLAEKTEELENEIAEYEAEQGVEEEQRVAIIGHLKKQVEKYTQACKEWEESTSEAAHVTDKIAKRVQSIFFKLQCDQYLQTLLKEGNSRDIPGLENLSSLLSGQGITESTVLEFMSLVEKRANDICSQYSRRQMLADPASATLSGPGSPSSWDVGKSAFSSHHSTFPPEDLENESSEEGIGPLNIVALRKEVEDRLSKSGKNAACKPKKNGHRNSKQIGQRQQIH